MDTGGPVVGEDGLAQDTAAAREEFERQMEVRRLGWRESDLASRRMSDPAKLAIAARLRQETTLSTKAIAVRAHLGTSKSANALLYQWMAQPTSADPQAQLSL